MKQVRVLTTGVFDLLHRGHLRLLSRAKRLGDVLIVAVQDDSQVRKDKGAFPLLSRDERIAQLVELPFVDEVVSYVSGTDGEIVRRIKPDILVQGDDWPTQTDRSRVIDALASVGGDLILLPHTQGISSTEIKRRMREKEETCPNGR